MGLYVTHDGGTTWTKGQLPPHLSSSSVYVVPVGRPGSATADRLLSVLRTSDSRTCAVDVYSATDTHSWSRVAMLAFSLREVGTSLLVDLIDADDWLVYAPAVTVAPEAGRMNVADRVVAVIRMAVSGRGAVR